MEVRSAGPRPSRGLRVRIPIEIDADRRSRLAHVGRLALLFVAVFAVVCSLAGQPALFREYRDRALSDSVTLANLAQLGMRVDTFALYIVGIGLMIVLVCVTVAAVVAIRRSRQPMALFVAVTLLLLGVTFTGSVSALGESVPALGWLDSVLTGLSIETVFLLLYLFPDGHFQPRWTRWPALVLSLMVMPSSLVPSLNVGPGRWLVIIAALTSGVASQIYRYRRISEEAARRQTRRVILSFTLGFCVYFLIYSLAKASPLFYAGTAGYLIMLPIGACGIMLIPLSWEFDVLISRTVLYGTLTAFFSGLAAALIGLFQKLFQQQTGSNSYLAYFFTALIVVASFTPIKNGVQLLLDRHLKPAPHAPAVQLTAAANGGAAPAGAHPEELQRLEELVRQFESMRSELATHARTETELRELIARLESKSSAAHDDHPPSAGPPPS